MKKIFLFVFLSISVYVSHGQVFHGGLFLGIAASQISGDLLSGFNKPGLYGGGFANVYFSEKIALQLEMYYIQKGSRKVYKQNAFDSYKLNLQYIEMALLFKWDFSRRFFFEMGPSIGVIMKTTGVEKDGYGLVPNPNRPAFNNTDLCGIVGLGVNIYDNFKINVRGENSIIPVRKPEVGTSWRLNRWQYNSTLTLSLIYQVK